MNYQRDTCSRLHLSSVIILIIVFSCTATAKGASTELWMKSDLVVIGSINSMRIMDGEELGVLTVSKVLKNMNTTLYSKGINPITKIFVKPQTLQPTERILFLKKIKGNKYQILKTEMTASTTLTPITENLGYYAMIGMALLVIWKPGRARVPS